MANKSIDQLLDLLIDALEERKGAREGEESADFPLLQPDDTPYVEYAAPNSTPDLLIVENDVAIETQNRVAAPVVVETLEDEDVEVMEADGMKEFDEVESAEFTPFSETENVLPEHIPMIDNMPRTMVRLFIALLVVVALANLQLFDLTTLNARFASGNSGNTAIRFARDGMLLRGDDLKVYLMEDNKRRWITTSEAFSAYGYRWGAVRTVGDEYIEQFAEGEPIYLAMRCPNSPHVFALDVVGETRRVRRWISDIETFEKMGLEWEQIDQSRCGFLRGLPNSEPFPADVDRQIPSP